MAAPDSLRRARPLLGTFVEISLPGASGDEAEAAIDAAFGAIAEVHRLMSFHDVDSDVSRLNRDASSRDVTVHPWTMEVLQTALEVHGRSSGVFDIAVAPVLEELGVLPRHLAVRGPSTTPATGIEAVKLLPDHQVRFRYRGIRIDLGGIAKGFAVDRAIEVLSRRGISCAIVNAGGDLAVIGAEPHQIFIRNPLDPRLLMCPVSVKGEALASSGVRRDLFCSAQSLGCAVIDPRTRRPVSAIVGASVRARNCMIADALTKVIMILGESASPVLRLYEASALLVFASGEVLVTPNWQGDGSLAA